MENNIEFNLQQQLITWKEEIKTQMSVTESDSEELLCHLLDLMDDLKKAGLDEEEAFIIAKKRMGCNADLDRDYQIANSPIIQMRKSLFILAGILGYFLIYYFIKFSSKLLLIILLSTGKNGYLAINWVSKYLIGTHFVFILFAASIYFLEKKTVSFIENIKMKPKHVVIVLFAAVVFCVTDTCLLPISKNLLRNGKVDGLFYDIYFYFSYSFPLLICTAFVILYIKYFKKQNFSK